MNFNQKHIPKIDCIEISSYSLRWPEIFEKEAAEIRIALGNNCIELHHFGSTSIPNLSAKPKIDILSVVKTFSEINAAALERLEFENRGEVIPSGRYFSKKTPPVHLHLFEEGNPLISQNLAFRDWLRSHPEDRIAYENLKRDLATRYHRDDGMAYCRAKTDFIRAILAKKDPVKH